AATQVTASDSIRKAEQPRGAWSAQAAHQAPHGARHCSLTVTPACALRPRPAASVISRQNVASPLRRLPLSVPVSSLKATRVLHAPRAGGRNRTRVNLPAVDQSRRARTWSHPVSLRGGFSCVERQR